MRPAHSLLPLGSTRPVAAWIAIVLLGLFPWTVFAADGSAGDGGKVLGGAGSDLDLALLVSIVGTDDPTHELLARAAELGLVAATARPYHGPGWWLVEGRPRDLGSVEWLERGMVLHPKVRYASAFTPAPRGGRAAPTRTLFAELAGPHVVPPLAPDLTLEELEPFGLGGVVRYSLEADTGSAVALRVDELSENPSFRWIESDAVITGGTGNWETGVEPPFEGSDYEDELWAHDNTGQFSGSPGYDLDTFVAWSFTRGSAEVPVCVIDTGVRFDHPDLAVAGGVDLTTSPPVGVPAGSPGNACEAHGTQVAGCLSAIPDNGIGVFGIAPDCPLYSARAMVGDSWFCNNSWSSQPSWSAAAITWAEQNGVRVTVNSNWYASPSSLIDTAYEQTAASGVMHFACSGNWGESEMTYPASLPTVHGIGAIQSDGSVTQFSNQDPELWAVAPGWKIWTTDLPGGLGATLLDHAMVSGTSFATPFAAGCAALLLSQDPTLTTGEVSASLEKSAMDLESPGTDPAAGHGLLRAGQALAYSEGLKPLLLTDVGSLNVAQGGTQSLVFDAGPVHAGRPYFICGSATQTGVPVVLFDVTWPFAMDAWHQFTLTAGSTPALSGFLGTLDGAGRAQAAVSLPPKHALSMTGQTLLHAGIVLDATFATALTDPSDVAALVLKSTMAPTSAASPSFGAHAEAVGPVFEDLGADSRAERSSTSLGP